VDCPSSGTSTFSVAAGIGAIQHFNSAISVRTVSVGEIIREL
jgi:hypothetical protein